MKFIRGLSPFFVQNVPSNAPGESGPFGSAQNFQQEQNVYLQITGMASSGTASQLPAYYFRQVFQTDQGEYLQPGASQPYLWCSTASAVPFGGSTGVVYELCGASTIPTDGSAVVRAWPRLTVTSSTASLPGVSSFTDEWECIWGSRVMPKPVPKLLIITTSDADPGGFYDALEMNSQLPGTYRGGTSINNPGPYAYKVLALAFSPVDANFYPSMAFLTSSEGESTAWGGGGVLQMNDVVAAIPLYTIADSSLTFSQIGTISSAISTGEQTVTPSTMEGIRIWSTINLTPPPVAATLIINKGSPDEETVVPTAVTSTTFTAVFSRAHGTNSTIHASWVDTTTTGDISSGVQTVTPVDMTGISVGEWLMIGRNTAEQEIVQVTAIGGLDAFPPTTFTATFANSHTSTPKVSYYQSPIVYGASSRPRQALFDMPGIFIGLTLDASWHTAFTQSVFLSSTLIQPSLPGSWEIHYEWTMDATGASGLQMRIVNDANNADVFYPAFDIAGDGKSNGVITIFRNFNGPVKLAIQCIGNAAGSATLGGHFYVKNVNWNPTQQ